MGVRGGRWALACAAICAGAGGCGESDVASVSCSDLTPAEAAKRWRNASHERTDGVLMTGDSPAAQLGFRMEECHTLDGMTRREVENVLGPRPDGGGRVWEYDAGPDSGADNWLVTVRFGRDGRVKRSYMGQS